MTTFSSSSPTASAVHLHHVQPADAQQQQQRGDAVLIDVREPFERATAYIEGSEAMPLASLEAERLREQWGGRRLIFQCKSGARSAEAAKRYAQAVGATEAWTLAGGMDAWRAAGLPVQRAAGAPKLDIMRQVQMIAGGLVVAGVLLGAWVHPAFLMLSGFVGAGLFFAGASGWCGMAKLLGVMPWNRVGSGKNSSDNN